jgi:two-component system NtrC family sensor kinase
LKELKAQLAGALLVVLTVAAVICAGINFQQQKIYRLPEDGVTWMDQQSNHEDPSHPGQLRVRVVAVHIIPESAADKAGVHPGDVLLRIGGLSIEHDLEVVPVLQRIGALRETTYTIEREGVEVPIKLIVGEAERDSALTWQYMTGLAYLSIGLFIYFRRGRAPRSLHFFLICLASFILHTFHYTGKLNNFDAVIYLGNAAAGLLAPALFLHFCFVFPEPGPGWGRTRLASIYLPVLSLLALQFGVSLGVVRTSLPLIELRWLLDRTWLAIFLTYYLAGAWTLHRHFLQADDPIVRQQTKWLRNGAVLGIVPFAALYAVPYVFGLMPAQSLRITVLSLALIPLAWAYAILRYRLMDVDIIFQQGYVYVLATLSVFGIVYAMVLSLKQRDELSPPAVILLVLVAAFIFEPLRNWIQQQLDRYVFYKDRYDYRRTLIGFARELSSEMDLDHMMQTVGERLTQTLSLSHAAFFLPDERTGQFRLHTLIDRAGARRALSGSELDLAFLTHQPRQPYLFFERTRHAFDVVSREMPNTVRSSIAKLDLTYYLPCMFRNRTIAWLGVSRTTKGDFLSSDDVDLLATLTGYVAMAVENSRLYRSLADKVEEYERLKEFSENIVESINVGILAADLDDRVESWNSQIERLTGIPRYQAVGRTLSELLPVEFVSQFDHLRSSPTIHQIYKVPLRAENLPLRASPVNGNGASPSGEEHRREIIVNVAVAPLVTRAGQQIGRLIIFDDVTDREDLERRLVQADKLSSIGLLAAGVAHEVNTPLAVISTYAQMLAKQVSGDEQKSRLLDKIAKQTFRASEIVNSLLSFSRTSSTDFEEVDLNRVIRETLTLIEHQLDKTGVNVSADLDPALPGIRGNAGKLQQVFLNLFLNARDAMEKGGTLSVRTFNHAGAARVEVQDNGPGIPREFLTRIFDPFFTTKAAKKGTGLGLSVSYGIVEEHGGTIEAGSDPGEGALFRIEFPAVRKAVNV